MSILAHNGGAVIAMAGKNCIAIGSDTRYGISAQTLAFDKPKVYQVTETCFVGFPGLLTDAQTVYQKLKFRVNLYDLREERTIRPSTLGNMIASMLYEKRFGPYFVEPIIAGMEDGKPFLMSMDLIGATMITKDFALGGTANEALYGMAETLWKPDMEPDELFETISQCLLSACDRDALSGWGAIVHVITKDQVISRSLKARQD
eukprot:TRINITY_DN1198_c0_g1_i1.p1 TRINITY_DN1198_c0_g1~~TRINITY_DN1198_c0_g1_i1.p1  ORF type:complete len:204 (+),score=34.24 TRINITY_DN1198_c0_g1_i1:98-709(+)